MPRLEPAAWWSVRPARSLKPATYRCPLCGYRLHALSPHVLIAPEGDTSRRRHAHAEGVAAAPRRWRWCARSPARRPTPPGKRSGGEKQPAALAPARALEPDLFLPDEPTSNLDRDGRAQTLGHQRQFALRAVAQDHAQLVAGRAADHIAAAQAGRDAFADGDDHFVGGAEAIGFIDHGQPVDRGHEIGAAAIVGLGFFDRLRQFGAQAGAVEMAGQFVTRGQINETLGFAAALGDDAQNAGQPLDPAERVGHAHAAHFEYHRAHGRGGLEFEIEGRVLRGGEVENFMQAVAAGRAHPAPEAVAAIKPIRIRMQGQDLMIAVPGDPIVYDRPVERDLTRGSHCKPEAIDLLGRCQCSHAVDWLLRKRLT